MEGFYNLDLSTDVGGFWRSINESFDELKERLEASANRKTEFDVILDKNY
jgi:hypothetical protein